jgi:hypothetical protein
MQINQIPPMLKNVLAPSRLPKSPKKSQNHLPKEHAPAPPKKKPNVLVPSLQKANQQTTMTTKNQRKVKKRNVPALNHQKTNHPIMKMMIMKNPKKNLNKMKLKNRKTTRKVKKNQQNELVLNLQASLKIRKVTRKVKKRRKMTKRAKKRR